MMYRAMTRLMVRRSAEALRERVAADPSFTQVLRGLVGQEVSLGQSAVSFGVGAQVGDVTIRDAAGRDIITINVYHGAAACGAMDMAGNVWEVMANDYRSYPAERYTPQKVFTDRQTAWRGGAWSNDSSYVRRGARDRSYLYDVYYGSGFRVVLAPRLAQ
ncbi:MAG: SUMF1/EgtB/PvdO family nonheme iron enzyme [Chloroflexales bacterium]